MKNEHFIIGPRAKDYSLICAFKMSVLTTAVNTPVQRE